MIKWRFCIVLLFLTFFASFASAQNGTVLGTVIPDENSEIKIFEDRIKAITESADIETELKTNLEKTYQDCIEQLRLINTIQATIADYKTRIQNAPEALKIIQEQLEKSRPAVEPPSADQTLAELEQKLNQLQAELARERENSTALEQEPGRRTTRRGEIPRLIAEHNDELKKISDQLKISAEQTQETELDKAAVVLDKLRQKKRTLKVQELQEELTLYDARGSLLTAQRELSLNKQKNLTQLIEQQQQAVNLKRRELEQQALRQAELALKQSAMLHPAVKGIAEFNSEIAQQAIDIGKKIESYQATNTSINRNLKELSEDYARLQDKVERVGLTDIIGVLLQSKRSQIPDISTNRQNRSQRLAEMSQAQYDHLQYEEQWRNLVVIREAVASRIDDAEPAITDAQADAITEIMTDLLRQQRESLKGLLEYYNTYTNILTEVDSIERDYIKLVQEYSRYVDEKILWVRDAPPISRETFIDARQCLNDTLQYENLAAIIDGLRSGWHQRPVLVTLGWAVFFLALIVNLKARKRLAQIAMTADSPGLSVNKSNLMFNAFALTIVKSLVWPVLVYIVGRTIYYGSQHPHARALALALMTLAIFDFVLMVCRNLCIENGLADAHFKLNQKSRRYIVSHLSWLFVTLQPLVLLTYYFLYLDIRIYYTSIGRLVFLALILFISFFLDLFLRPGNIIMTTFFANWRNSWINKTRYLLYLCFVAGPLAIATLSWMGYCYAAWQLQSRFLFSAVIGLAAILAHTLIYHRLIYTKRKLVSNVVMDETAEQTEARATRLIRQKAIINLAQQAARFLKSIMIVLYIVALWTIWRDVFPALAGYLNNIVLWNTVTDGVSSPVSLGVVLKALIVFVLTIMIARNITGILSITILKSISDKEGTRFAITTLTKYMIVVIGMVLAFAAIGVGWGKVQWLAAAFTVGLGFGLQEIFANFTSGLIILFEQPMRVGDIITSGDVSGRVTEINIRSTTIRCWDRKELIVPNKEFITNRLINWTLSDKILRMQFFVGVAYGSDIEKVERTLLQIAQNDERILKDPEPLVIFQKFGDSSLDFELRYFVPNLDNYTDLLHQTNCAIDKAFRQQAISISFPQRDIHIRSVQQMPFPVNINNPDQLPQTENKEKEQE